MARALDQLSSLTSDVANAPEADLVVSPRSVDDVIKILRIASDQDLKVQVLGGGTHSGYGLPERPDIVLSMDRLGEVERWEPDDMTIVAGAGARVADIESMLTGKNQTAVLPEVPGHSTLGGVIAAGVSSLRRGRLFGTRERVLEATVVTGDGRVVRSGGRVVKNVTGYDLHRLHVGAFGSLGVLVSVCLKLWPTPPAAATVTVNELAQAKAAVRPLAVLEDSDSVRVYIWGTKPEVEAKAEHLGGEFEEGHSWPGDPTGDFTWSLRVPPAMTSESLRRLPDGWRYLAVHGVGEIRLGSDTADGAAELRFWAETLQGHLVNTSRPPGFDDLDPWGAPPPGLKLQKALIHQFDPNRVINPGRLPGGL
jgi:glycolate oxidase FAD binding subunit